MRSAKTYEQCMSPHNNPDTNIPPPHLLVGDNAQAFAVHGATDLECAFEQARDLNSEVSSADAPQQMS